MKNPAAIVASRLEGYRKRILHEHSMWNLRRISAKNHRRYERWEATLRKSCSDVYIGGDQVFGGIRNHIHAIKAKSSLRVQILPDEVALGGIENFTQENRDRFMRFEPTGKPAIHTHVFPWAIRWGRIQQSRGLRWVHTYHNMYFAEFAREKLEPWQHEFNTCFLEEACHADVRLSVSRWQQEHLRSAHGIETDYLPNGVDVSVCDQGRAERFRRRHKLYGPFILYVGRNDPVKNPADFVRLAQKLPQLNFAMVGPGLDQSVLFHEWDLQTPPNLRYLGATSHLGVQDALAACSALVVTSKREGLPTLVLEAMAHGKPIVVPQEAGCVEAIGGGDFGFIYQQANIQSLVHMTTLALGDTDRCTKSRERILTEYDWQIVAAKLDRIYQDEF